MKALGRETVPGVSLEAEMNFDWTGWTRLVEEITFGPSFLLIPKPFNEDQLCASHCSGSWDTVVKEVPSLIWLIFWLREKASKQQASRYTGCHMVICTVENGLPRWFRDKESAHQCRKSMSLILGLGRSPGGGNSNPLQYSCLGNPSDREV